MNLNLDNTTHKCQPHTDESNDRVTFDILYTCLGGNMRKPLRLYSRMPLHILPLTLRHRDICAWSPDTVNTIYIIVISLLYLYTSPLISNIPSILEPSLESPISSLLAPANTLIVLYYMSVYPWGYISSCLGGKATALISRIRGKSIPASDRIYLHGIVLY